MRSDAIDRPLTRRGWLQAALATTGAAAVPIRLNAIPPQAAGWTLKFTKVKGNLDVRVDGPNGQLISWADRGGSGRHTWTTADNQPETRSIDHWVKAKKKFSLHARIARESESDPTDPFCQMETFFNGQSKGEWRFQDQANHEYTAEPPAAPPAEGRGGGRGVMV